MSVWAPLTLAGAAVLLGRRALGRTRPARGYTQTPQAAWEHWRDVILRYPSPLPPPVMALRIARESGGNVRARAIGKVVGGSEWGLTQVYAPWRKDTPTGARGADADPLTPIGAIYTAQWVADREKQLLERVLPDARKNVPDDNDVRAWIALLEAEHSIGHGGIMTVMRRYPAVRDPLEAMRRAAAAPFAIGRMSASKVGARLRRVLGLAEQAHKLHPLPDSIAPLGPRGDDVPRFDARKLRAIDPRYEV